MTLPEKIEDFKCSNCNQNITINKRTSLYDLPNVLFILLKRFYMNYEYERTEKKIQHLNSILKNSTLKTLLPKFLEMTLKMKISM